MKNDTQLELFASLHKTEKTPKQPEQKKPIITPKKTSTKPLRVCIDGASRGNPGNAGIGIICFAPDNTVIFKRGYYLGQRTNNQAEYAALIIAALLLIKYKAKLPTQRITIISDSQLLVRQMSGLYKIKNPILQQLHTLAHTLLATMEYSFEHVLREFNTHADALANKGVDTKTKIPEDFITTLAHHNITL